MARSNDLSFVLFTKIILSKSNKKSFATTLRFLLITYLVGEKWISEPLRKEKGRAIDLSFFETTRVTLVGMTGFEPATP